MYAIAFDVGESTGVVLAKVERDRMPLIQMALTIKNDQISKSIKEADTFVRAISTEAIPTVVLVELPFITKLSNRRKSMETMRTMWSSWINSTFDHPAFSGPIYISPSQWKATPSGRVDVFQAQVSNHWLLYKPTRHEKDAAAMLHWYTVWTLGKL